MTDQNRNQQREPNEESLDDNPTGQEDRGRASDPSRTQQSEISEDERSRDPSRGGRSDSGDGSQRNASDIE